MKENKVADVGEVKVGFDNFLPFPLLRTNSPQLHSALLPLWSFRIRVRFSNKRDEFLFHDVYVMPFPLSLVHHFHIIVFTHLSEGGGKEERRSA